MIETMLLILLGAASFAIICIGFAAAVVLWKMR